MRRWIFLMAVLSLVFGSFGGSVAADRPENIIKSNLDTVISILRDQQVDSGQKTEMILQIVSPLFDFDLMAKLALGRKYWPGLSEENRDQFSYLFIKLLKDSYVGNLTLYSDERIVYENAVADDNKAQVPTFLVSKNNRISMLYKLYQSPTGWKIYDIEIQGISLIMTYRSQFDQILKSGTFDDLLLKLKEQSEDEIRKIDVTDLPILKQK